MQRKHILGAVGVTAALAGGGLLGATLGVPSITSAQTDPGTTEPAAPDDDGAERDGRFRGGSGHGLGAKLEVAAEVLGLSEDELRDALQDGQSLADVAGEQGVEVQAVIDALVADATTRIDEAVADGDLEADRAEELKAELPERIADVVNREGFGRRSFGPGRGFGPGCEDGDGDDTEEPEVPESEGSSFTT